VNDADKREFLAAFVEIGVSVYEKTPQQVKAKIPMYWDALRHRSMNDVKAAINSHLRDPSRGQFFPKPADIEAKMPVVELWPDAEEAWAMCPKDEYSSAAMNDEAMQALSVAHDLMSSGDMIAARMSFKSAYNRLVEESKRAGRVPHWFASLGHDPGGRYVAEVKTVELKNRLLPPDKQLSLPSPPDEAIGVGALFLSSPESFSDPDTAKKAVGELRRNLGVKVV